MFRMETPLAKRVARSVGGRLLALVDGVSLLAGAWSLLLAFPQGPSLEIGGLITSRDSINPAIFFFATQTLLLFLPASRPLYLQRIMAGGRAAVNRALPRMALPNQAALILMCIGTVLSVAYVVKSVDEYGPTIAGDGLGHYAYVRSLLIDGDFDFRNEFHDYSGGAALPSLKETATGLVGNPWPVGPAILWLPAFAVAHQSIDPHGDVARNGYSQPYHTAIVFASVAYGLLGLLVSFLCALRFASAGMAFVAVGIVFWATPALFYLTGDPPMPHSMSILSVGVAVFTWLRWRESTAASAYLLFGAATGFCALIRFQDGVVGILPVWSLANLSGYAWRQRLGLLLWFIGGFVLVSLPQLWVFRQIYGTWLLVPQGGSFLHLSDPAILGLLFSWQHGFVSWTPIAVLLLASTIMLAVRKPVYGVPLMVFVVAEVYLAAAAGDWWGGAAFGARRLVSLTAPFSVALAVTLSWSSRPTRIVICAFSALLALWNVVLVEGYRLGAIDDYDPVNIIRAAPELFAARLGESFSMSERFAISAGDVKRLVLLLTVVLFGMALRRAAQRIVSDEVGRPDPRSGSSRTPA